MHRLPLPKARGQASGAEGKSVLHKSQALHPSPPQDEEEQKAKAPEKKLDGRAVFDIALKNVAPIMELKSRRIGGANYQVPMEVMEPRKTTLAMRWLLIAARSKKGVPWPKIWPEKLWMLITRPGSHEEARRRAPYGRSQQGFCALCEVWKTDKTDHRLDRG